MSVQAFDQRPDEPPRLPRNDFDVPFAEAIAWAQQRGAKLAPEFYGARLQAIRARSFTVAGLATLDQVQQVADAASAATASGQTFRDWQRAVLASPQGSELFSLGRARRELIFRNAVQTNYGVGRTIQQRENAAARPYLMWDAINDSRTRPAHRAMDGHIAPIDAPIWRVWSAPAGHQCRCTRIALTEAQARARGYPKDAPGVEPDKGWEGDPTEGNEDLLKIVKARQDACAVGFAARGARARGLWCDEGPARDLLAAALRSVAENPSMRQPQGLFTPYDITEPRGMPDVSTPGRAAAVAFENEVRLQSLEHGAAFAADGRLILRKQGEPDRIGYADAELLLMRGAVFTHNHPNGVSFSVADVKLAAKIGLLELRAAGPQFRHSLMPGSSGWGSADDVEGVYLESLETARKIVDDLVLRQGLRPASASGELMHRGWLEFARRRGMAYVREYS